MNPKQLEADLKGIVGNRFTLSTHETWFYRRDLLKMPHWAERLAKTTADALVAPKNTEEVSAVLKYCDERTIPVTPRGGGSSGLFGAVPKEAGILIDLRGLGGEAVVDRDALSVCCSSAMTWWELDKRLRRDGLTLKSYPSSARSASLAGWIMTTGLGIGSIRHGPVHDQVSSAEIVSANGIPRKYDRGNGLGIFMGSEGLLGVMSSVSIDVRALPESSSHDLVYFGDIDRLAGFLEALMDSSEPPYAVEFFDYGYLAMLKNAGYETTGFSRGGAVALVTYDGTRTEVASGRESLAGAVLRCSGEKRWGGEEEWDHRFVMLRVRRAAPSLIPGSVHIPLSELKSFCSHLSRLNKRPIGLLGHVVSRHECVLMPMIASDETERLEYTLALRTPAELSNLAVSLGGGPGGGLGLWNAAYRNSPGMKAKYAAIEAKKKELDPKGILNPGMWTPPPWLLRPPVYRTAVFLGRAVDAVVPRMRQRTLLSGSRKEFADCVQCGYCMGYCPTHQEWLSSTPRGRILAARERLLPAADSSSPLGRESVEDIFECTLCGRCKVDCSVRIKSPEMWTDLRCELSRAGSAPEALKTLVRTIEETHNLAAKPNEQRGRWLDALKLAHRKQTAETAYFVGCVTSFYPMVQDVARSFAQILNKAGTDFAILGGEEWCCGYPLLSAGEGEKAANHIESNIDKLTAFGARRIVTTCTGCYRMWKQDYPRITGKEVPFEVLHSTQVISSLIERGSIDLGEMKARVTYHDPCDLGRNAGMYDEPRSIISRIPGVEFVELESNREYCNCCGSGGDLLASNQALSLEIAGRKVKEVLDTGAESVVTACPSCIRAITMARLAQKAPFTVQDISQLVWKAMRK